MQRFWVVDSDPTMQPPHAPPPALQRLHTDDALEHVVRCNGTDTGIVEYLFREPRGGARVPDNLATVQNMLLTRWNRFENSPLFQAYCETLSTIVGRRNELEKVDKLRRGYSE